MTTDEERLLAEVRGELRQARADAAAAEEEAEKAEKDVGDLKEIVRGMDTQLEHLANRLSAEIERAEKTEAVLRHLEAIVARRPALDDLPSLPEKIGRAISTAARADVAENRAQKAEAACAEMRAAIDEFRERVRDIQEQVWATPTLLLELDRRIDDLDETACRALHVVVALRGCK